MTTAVVNAPERFSEGEDYLIPAAEIFESGVHRGKEYNDQNLDEICSNFAKFSTGDNPLLRVPCVLGHEEADEQWLLNASGLPAAAWVSRVWRDGHVLMAEFVDMPPEVADAIIHHRFRTVSAEIYPEPPEGIPGHGMMLRRVAFLGGDVPQVKSLADLPRPVKNREHGRRVERVRLQVTGIETNEAAGSILFFSEVKAMPLESGSSQDVVSRNIAELVKAGHDQKQAEAIALSKAGLSNKHEEASMNRDQMLAELAKCGFDTSIITDAVPDDFLAETLRNLSAKKDDAAAAVQNDDGAKPEGDKDKTSPDMMDDEPMPEPTDAASASAYFERAKKLAEKYGCKMDDKVVGQDTLGLVTAGKQPERYAEQAKELLAIEARAKKALEQLRKETAEVERFEEQRGAAVRKATAEADIALLVKDGRVPPAWVDAGLVDLVMLWPHERVETFAEADGKKVKATPFDRGMAILKRLPKLHLFSEKLRGGGQSSADEQKAIVAEHYDRFSERFSRIGTTKDAFLKAFEKRRQQDPEVTAEQFLAVRKATA